MAKKVYIETEEEGIKALTIGEAAAFAVSKLKEDEDTDLPDYDADTSGAQVCEFLIEGALAEQGEPDWDNFNEDIVKAYQKINEIITDLAKDSKKNEEAFNKAEAEAKEKAKQEKEQVKEKADLRKQLFASAAESGISKAKEEFKKELTAIKDSLPKGVTIQTNDSGGSQLIFEEGATEEVIAEAMAYFMAQSDNTQYLAGQLQFYAGDAVKQSVAIGVYKDNKEAAGYISAQLEKSINYKLNPRTLENYARMSERIPGELRSISVDPSAYFVVASAALPKKVKGEKDDDFKKRVEDHANDRTQLLEMMKKGKATVIDDKGNEVEAELTSRKDVLPMVENLQIKHGLLTKKDPSEMGVADYLKQFYFAYMAKENLVGVSEKNAVIFRVPDKVEHPDQTEIEIATGEKIKIVSLDVGTLTDYMEESMTNLQNILFNQQGLTMADFMEGTTEVKVDRTEEVEGKTVKIKDPITKKPLTDTVEVPAYPTWPFKNTSPEKVAVDAEEAAA